MKITDNFTLGELLRSGYAERNMIGEQFTPGPAIIDNLKRLCVTILQPFRYSWGKPVKITSGYRCPRVNSAVGGVKNSAHIPGLAADISYSGEEEGRAMVKKLIAVGARRIGVHKRFIHVDIDYGRPTPALFNYGKSTPEWFDKKFIDEHKKMMK